MSSLICSLSEEKALGKDIGYFSIGLLVGGGIAYFILRREINIVKSKPALKRCNKETNTDILYRKFKNDSPTSERSSSSSQVYRHKMESLSEIVKKRNKQRLASLSPSKSSSSSVMVGKLNESHLKRSSPNLSQSSGLLSSSSPRGREKENILKKVDSLLDGNDRDKNKAFEILNSEKTNIKMAHNSQYLQRLSRATFYQAQQEQERSGKFDRVKPILETAKRLAQEAISLDDSNGEAYKWAALTMGTIADMSGMGTALKLLNPFTKNLAKALELAPRDPVLNHMMGRFHFQIADMSWTKKLAIGKLATDTSGISYQSAIDYFKKSEELDPGKGRDNFLYIGKCYIGMQNNKEAIKWLTKAERIPPQPDSKVDEHTLVEVKKLLEVVKA